MPIANTGAVLSVLGGPKGCDPAFQVIWSVFRTIRTSLAVRPEEIQRIYRMLDDTSKGCILAMGLSHSATVLDLGYGPPCLDPPWIT